MRDCNTTTRSGCKFPTQTESQWSPGGSRATYTMHVTDTVCISSPVLHMGVSSGSNSCQCASRHLARSDASFARTRLCLAVWASPEAWTDSTEVSQHSALDSMDSEVTGQSDIDGGKISQGSDQPSPSETAFTHSGPTPCTPLGDTTLHNMRLLPLLSGATVVGRTWCCAQHANSPPSIRSNCLV